MLYFKYEQLGRDIYINLEETVCVLIDGSSFVVFKTRIGEQAVSLTKEEIEELKFLLKERR